MSGYVDLHLHVVPGVDDGARDRGEALAVLQGLRQLGFAEVVTTPHIRPGMFDNTASELQRAFATFAAEIAGQPGLPQLGLSAEHHCDGQLLELVEGGGLLPYPGGKAILLELPYELLPPRLPHLAFKLEVKGLRPVIAHPERCAPLFASSDPVDELLAQGVGFQLDLMSLVGKYGRRAKAAAERMLEEGVYSIAASDCHGPDDVARVGKALERLFSRSGDEEALLLVRDNPRRLLSGEPTE